MRRRQLLCCAGALGAGLFSALVAHGVGPLRNPCAGALPQALADDPLLRQAFDGIDPSLLWDTHAHLLGTGDAGSGCTVHASMHQWWRPVEVVRRHAIMNAACLPDDAASVDAAYLAQLRRMADEFPRGARWLLFAFEQAHDDRGQPRPDWSTFHVPNDYAAQVAARHRDRFDWVASIHPYRDDALPALERAAVAGARAVKWLPSAMNIDLADARCRPFYERLRALALPLVVHCGEEHAVPGAGRDAYGNPLHVRHALDAGVRVIVAHAASLGHAPDLDKRSQPRAASFDLFARLMDSPAYGSLLHADISAVFQVNRPSRIGRTLLLREDWHARLLHGSDHPLPGVMPLFRPDKLAADGLLDREAVEPLKRIRLHNPLLFDFVLKRAIHHGSVRFNPLVFASGRLWSAPDNSRHSA